VPKKAKWLWIATAELGIKRAGPRGRKITPALYNAAGYDKKIGPLVRIRGSNPNEALLIVRKVSVSTGGRRSRIRPIPANGRVRGNREARDFIVAFVGIKQTTRTQRFDARALLMEAAGHTPRLVEEYLRRNL
jgi:hypothetical protein